MNQGERVRHVRKNLKMTLERFGSPLGVKRSAISGIERGERGLTEQMARAICREYHVNYDWLVSGVGEPFEAVPSTALEALAKDYKLDELDMDIINIYLQLPEDARSALKDTIKKQFGGGDQPDREHGEALLAAHARDVGATPEGQKHDLDIMMNDDEW